VVGRSGLGNMLFPWARAEIFARDHRAALLEPAWNGIRIGPWLRGEPDKRSYFNFFRGRHHIRGLDRYLPLLFGERMGEQQFAMTGRDESRRLVVVFRGLGNLFQPIRSERPFIRERLWNMTNPDMRGDLDQTRVPFIAMHVRRGDITRQGLTKEQIGATSQYAPLDWYVAMVNEVRNNCVLRQIPVAVFSDGSESELEALLAIPNVRLHRRRSAIADMWTISRANLLFAGGASTFAMWASYLGAMPTAYAPGKLLHRVQAGQPDGQEVEIDESGAKLEEFLAKVRADNG
jgi:hypothetical protein